MFPKGKHPLGNKRAWAGWVTPNTSKPMTETLRGSTSKFAYFHAIQI